MPLSSVKIEVEHCLDAKMAQDELLALARALAVEDTRLHHEMAGEPDLTTFNDPEIVCQVMKDEKGMLWEGRLSVSFYPVGVDHDLSVQESMIRARAIGVVQDGRIFLEVVIPGYGRWNARRDMSSEGQVDMFEEYAVDQGVHPDVIATGKNLIREALSDDG